MADAPATRLPGPVPTRFHTIDWFRTIDSTNRHLLDLARTDGPDGLVAIADEQLAGRGRLGRTWQAPVGASLLVSVLVRPSVAPEEWPTLVGAAGIAAVEVLTVLCDLPARLKWPNDVVVGDAKIAGVLAESTGSAVVVGMGLNVTWSEVPPDLAGIATAVSLAGGRVQPRLLLLHEWLRRLDHWLHLLEHDPRGESILRHAQRARSATLGRRVRVDLTDTSFEGVAHALAPNGHLVVRADDGTRHDVSTGDVVHLRPV